MQDFEKKGIFYLGKKINPATGKPEDNLLLYNSKDLTTHAVCVGMTGSGKTGLGIALLEEAALDKIPAIIIDPKGDLSNLLLTFPHLSPAEFRPWIDTAEAERKEMSPEKYAEYVAKTWSDGLAAWNENAERIKKFRNSVDLAVYTPASNAGIPISILSSFAAPSKEEMLDSTAVREKIQSVTSSLLGLLGINADPIKSREHIIISTIIEQSWQKGIDLDIAALIQKIQQPSFTKIGALDIDTFYPAKERLALSISLNNLLASPGFQAWLQGQPLDISQLLATNTGKPKLSIISIAHLSDAERMFFITLLLNEFVVWMRRQPGTSNLRALLYMDEIFGFFPPTATPPSKLPMLTLLKQARAFGIGIILATQNPVDLDYKGLANCGTWFIGKLQTERDKARVLEGLKTASNGEVDAKTLDKMLALTGNRIFMMRSIHEKDPILFQTRWTLSYLRGPLTLSQIATFKDPSQKNYEEITSALNTQVKNLATNSKPNVPSGINEFFAHFNNSQPPLNYEPRVAGIAQLHFVDAKNKVDVWQTICFALPPDKEGKNVNWNEGVNIPDLKDQLQKEAIPGSTFEGLPSGLIQEKNYAVFAKQLANALYQNQTFTLYQTTNPNMVSDPNESEKDFHARVAIQMNEQDDELIKKLREKFSPKITALSEKIQKAQEKVAQKQQKAGSQKLQTWISFGSTVLGALFGKGITKGTISQAGTSLQRATRLNKNSQDATQAEEEVSNYQQQLQDLEIQMNHEISSLNSNAEKISINTISVHPRKNDVTIEQIALVWWPQ